MHSWAHSPPVPTANLTGHEEKVSVENFELLKVLGTGGEDPPTRRADVPGTVPWASCWHTRLGLGLGQATGNAPHPFLAQLALPAPPCPARVACPFPGPNLPAGASAFTPLEACSLPKGFTQLLSWCCCSERPLPRSANSPARVCTSLPGQPSQVSHTSASLPWICTSSIS